MRRLDPGETRAESGDLFLYSLGVTWHDGPFIPTIALSTKAGVVLLIQHANGDVQSLPTELNLAGGAITFSGCPIRACDLCLAPTEIIALLPPLLTDRDAAVAALMPYMLKTCMACRERWEPVDEASAAQESCPPCRDAMQDTRDRSYRKFVVGE